MEGEEEDQEQEVENAPFECKKSHKNRVECKLFWSKVSIILEILEWSVLC